MSQFGFPNLSSPTSGEELIDDNLEPAFDAIYSNHMGSSRPSYASAGIIWIDNNTTPWALKVFDGTDDIIIGNIDISGNVFTPVSGLGTLFISSNDTTLGYLNGKLIAGANTGLVLSELNNGSNETLKVSLDFNGTTAETAPAVDDELIINDKSESSGTVNKITLENTLKVVNGLTEDTTPDASNDFFLSFDTSAGAAKKVKPVNITVDVSQISGTLPITSGGTGATSASSARTALGADNASNLTSGTVATGRLGSGTANSTTFLRGDGTWASPGGSTTAGDVGTYGLFSHSGVALSFGSTTSGSQLTPAAADGTASGSTQSGTWRCMGRTDTGSGASRVSLFVRIS